MTLPELNTMPLRELIADGSIICFRRKWWSYDTYCWFDVKGGSFIIGKGTEAKSFSLSRDDVLAADWHEYKIPPKKE